MSKNKKVEERLKLTFAHYKDLEKVFATSDNNVFTDKKLCEDHAVRLDDKKITTYKREDVLSESKGKAKAEAEPKAAEVAEAKPDADNAKDIEVTDQEEVKASKNKK